MAILSWFPVHKLSRHRKYLGRNSNPDCILYIKIPSTNELLTGQSMDTVLARLMDFTRYLIIGKSFILFFYDKLAKEWLIILPIYFFLLGKTKQHVNEESIKTPFVIVLFMIGGYFFIYLITAQKQQLLIICHQKSGHCVFRNILPGQLNATKFFGFQVKIM